MTQPHRLDPQLQTIDSALGPTNVECPVCEGGGWECEEHPGRRFPHDDCAGPGMPCRCRPGAKDHRSDLG